MPHAEVTLPGATSSVPTARRFVESLLSSWGFPDLAWSAAMCVSELAGNCALHARTRFAIRVELEGGVARIEVSDGSVQVPAQRSYGADATTGRGLRLVEEYATSWGIDITGDGKTVWVVLHDQPPQSLLAHGADAADVDGLLAAFDDGGETPRASGVVELTWQVAA